MDPYLLLEAEFMQRFSDRAGLRARLLLAGLLVAGLTALGTAPARAQTGGSCSVVSSPCTLDGIVTQALTDAPGTEAVSAGFAARRAADGSEVVLFKVVVRSTTDGSEQTLYYDASDCSAVIPPTIVVPFNDALADALAAAEAAAPGPAPAVALSGRLVRELLAPTYVFKIIDPQQMLVIAKVDALVPDQVELKQPTSGKKKSKSKGKKRRGKRARAFDCDHADSDSDLDSDSDGDSDSDEDSDSDGTTIPGSQP
jgi:hypothetical protein